MFKFLSYLTYSIWSISKYFDGSPSCRGFFSLCDNIHFYKILEYYIANLLTLGIPLILQCDSFFWYVLIEIQYIIYFCVLTFWDFVFKKQLIGSFYFRYNILRIEFYVYITGSTVCTYINDEHSLVLVDKFLTLKIEVILRNGYFCCWKIIDHLIFFFALSWMKTTEIMKEICV